MRRSARLQAASLLPASSAGTVGIPTDDVEGASAKPRHSSPKRTAVSCKLLQCDVAKLRSCAGVGVAPTKDPVVRWMFAGDASINPSYNRISGVLEWDNAVIVWVNIDDDSSYANVFADNGETLHFTWFGATRHHLESPIIQKMLKLSKEESCFLFCRFKGGDYMCCGRIIFITSDEHNGRLRIIWLIADRNRMMAKWNVGCSSHLFIKRESVNVGGEEVKAEDEALLEVKQEAPSDS